MIYHVFANRSNIGDWLSAKGIQKLIGSHRVVECLCDEPFVEETIAVLSAASESDLIIIGGGGLLMDYFTPFWEAFRPVATKVPFCVWGIGYCDLKYEHTLTPSTLIENILRQSKLCIVRDEMSRSHLPHCNLPAPVECPSINVINQLQQKGNDILHVNNYTTVGADAYEVMCEVTRKFAGENGVMYRETNNRINKDSEKQLEETISLYTQSGVVVSSALHGCIIGVAMGLKVIAVSGDWKIDAFMEAVGLSEWVLDSTEVFNLPSLLDRIGQQKFPDELLESIRNKNREVGTMVRKMMSQNVEVY